MKRYLALVAIMLLCPAAVMAHDSGLVYARLERGAPGGKVTLQATVECLSNPLVADQEAAREALGTMFDIQVLPGEQTGIVSRAATGTPLAEPTWSVQTEWTDPSVPVPVESPEDDADNHCWVTARWELELSKHEAACLHVNSTTKLGVLLWEVYPSGQSPDGRTRWQILLAGDRSARLNFPNGAPTNNPVVQTLSRQRSAWGLSIAANSTIMVILGALGAVPLARLLLSRSSRRSCVDFPE